MKDFDRPLNKRGLKDAELIGKFLGTKKIHPDLLISSPAERARQTVDLVLKSSSLQVELRFDERIYEASVTRLFEVISQIEDTVEAVVLVGHNPGFAELLHGLTGEMRDFSTAGLACVELSIEKWGKVRPSVGHVKWFVAPKDLRHD